MSIHPITCMTSADSRIPGQQCTDDHGTIVYLSACASNSKRTPMTAAATSRPTTCDHAIRHRTLYPDAWRAARASFSRNSLRASSCGLCTGAFGNSPSGERRRIGSIVGPLSPMRHLHFVPHNKQPHVTITTYCTTSGRRASSDCTGKLSSAARRMMRADLLTNACSPTVLVGILSTPQVRLNGYK